MSVFVRPTWVFLQRVWVVTWSCVMFSKLRKDLEAIELFERIWEKEYQKQQTVLAGKAIFKSNSGDNWAVSI